jgi:uncharacterized protein (DUF1330 family)
MAYYFLAQIKVNDPDTYQKYINGAGEVFSRYNGQYLAVDEKPQILEGSWNYTKSVIIRFPSEEDFKMWYTSSEYQELLRFRLSAAQCDTILVKGLDV